MEERDKCNSHPKEQISLICKEKGCNQQPLCPKCVPKHFKHVIVDIEEYWEEKLLNIDSADIEGRKLKQEMKDPNIHQKDNILATCGDMKKYILHWGRMLESKITKSISSDVKSMIKSINNYENGVINNIQDKSFDMSKIMENIEQSKKYKKKMKKALNSSKFSQLSTYYKELTKREKKKKDILHKMMKKGKNMRSEIIIEEMKKKTEKGIKELIEHINQVLYGQKVDLKGLEGTLKKVEKKKVKNIPKIEEKQKNIPKVEEKREKTPKREKQHTFQGIISASWDKSLIFWDKEYKQKSTHKGKCSYFKLIKLSSGGIAATTGDPDNSVEILENNLELLSIFRGHTYPIYDICNMGERNIITGSGDKTMRIWDIRSGECSQILKGHTKDVNCVHLHSKSGYLLTGSNDQTVRIWDITNTPQSYKEIDKILHKGMNNYVQDLVELDEGRMLSICGSGFHLGQAEIGVKVWELRGKETATIKDIPPHNQENKGFICGLGISGTKGVLLGGMEGNLVLFDVGSYLLSPLIHNLHMGFINQIKELKQNIYVTCSSDKSIKIVNVATKKVLQTLQGHTGWVRSILPIFAEDKE